MLISGSGVVWAAAQGKTFDLAAADAKTTPRPEINTNYRPSRKNGSTEYLYGDDALASFTTAPGYKIALFASEKEFPNLNAMPRIDNTGDTDLYVVQVVEKV